MKTILSLFMIGIAAMLLTGCSGGGGEEAPATVQSEAPTPRSPQPVAQPDMLTATPQGILRGKANGQGQREILRVPNLLQSNMTVDDGNIVYPRTGDIWTVRADGTGDRELIKSVFLQAVSWPWVLYDNGTVRSLNAVTQEQFPILSGGDVQLKFAEGRIINTEYSRITSRSFTGTDLLVYIDAPDRAEIPPPAIVADRLVYRRVLDDGSSPPVIVGANLFSVPVLGGPTIPLDSGQSYAWFAGALGSRVVYHRCLITGPCNVDVVSVNLDGSAPVVLASDPANEAVQGITTSQVIIRRNLSGNDQLIAVPVTGGAETLLMTMTDNEFVDTVVDDTIIVRRPSGTWTLSLTGTLKQLNNIAGLDTFVPVGNAICSSDPVWCMPLDGSTPAVKIANTGRVLGVVQ